MPVQEHILKYEDVLKLNGLGWIEYTLPLTTSACCAVWQPLIELKNGSVILVCLIKFIIYFIVVKINDC